MSPDFTPPHADLTFMAPLSEERASRLVGFLADGSPGTVLDIGCGWAELLLRVLERAPDAIGEGVDLDAVAIAHGQALADPRGLTDRVDLRVERRPRPAGRMGPRHLHRRLAGVGRARRGAAAAAVRRRAGRAACPGPSRWSGRLRRRHLVAAADAGAVAPLAGRDDEFRTLGEVAELAVQAGFAPLAVHEASLDEWDVFESGYAAGYARWLAEHDADDPEADEVRELAERQRAAYFSGYRGILGLGYLELLAV